MKGTADFRGDRLREAREARGLTVSALADLLNLSRVSVGRYEKGVVSPPLEVVGHLTEVLRVPAPFLFKPGPVVSDTLFYRSLVSNTKVSRLRAERKYGWLKQLFGYIRGFVRTPPANMPALSAPSDPFSIDDSFIEAAAMLARSEWGLGSGPISNVMLLLENNGIVVSRSFADSPHMDGYSSIDEYSGQPFAILASDKGVAVRSRFDLAHELGHLLLHRNVPSAYIRNPVNNKLLESQAHAFAGAFLMPEQAFANDLWVVTLDSLKDLKSRWLVSIGAMLYRAGNLGWLTDDQRRSLWINYSRRGWKRCEPLDDEIEVETPRMLSRALKMIVEKGGVSPSRIVEDLCLPPADRSELAGLESSYLASSVDLDYLFPSDFERDIGETQIYKVPDTRKHHVN